MNEKCQKCKKKCFISFKCKCEKIFCTKCKLPEDHNCTFNFKEAGKDKLKQQLIKVENNKINKI